MLRLWNKHGENVRMSVIIWPFSSFLLLYIPESIIWHNQQQSKENWKTCVDRERAYARVFMHSYDERYNYCLTCITKRTHKNVLKWDHENIIGLFSMKNHTKVVTTNNGIDQRRCCKSYVVNKYLSQKLKEIQANPKSK